MRFLFCAFLLVSMYSCSYRYAIGQDELELIQEHQTFLPWEKGRIHYIERGKGPRHVVLLHGFGANTFTWEKQIDLLAKKGFHVWAIDFLGFGFSDKPLEIDYSIDLYREQIEVFLKAKNIQKADVIAHSMGGAIALDFAATHPEKIHSLILIDPLAYPVKMPFFYTAAKTLGKLAIPFFSKGRIHHTLKKVYYDPGKITEKAVDAYWLPLEMEGGREAAIHILQAFDEKLLIGLKNSYAAMKMPILFIWGGQDTWIPVSHLDSLLNDFPHAKGVAIPECGHAPQEEKPEDVNREIVQFLQMQQKEFFRQRP